MKSILDPSFRYSSSLETDIGRTFARIRREQGLAAAVSEQPDPELRSRGFPLRLAAPDCLPAENEIGGVWTPRRRFDQS